jgi:tripartite-type tricarboxylate transporter receptor subunit TctC
MAPGFNIIIMFRRLKMYSENTVMEKPCDSTLDVHGRETTSIFTVAIMLIFVFACIMPVTAWSAEKYPNRSVEIVVGSPPGGLADTLTRMLARYFEKYLKTSFVPINKPGPSQMMAASYVAKSKPDGYTIGQLGNPVILAELTGQASGYTMDELRIICQLTTFGLVIAVPDDSPWKTFQNFVDYARKNPGVKYAHHGVGSGPHQRMELLNKHANLGLTGIPLKGDAEILPALLGKHVPIGVLSPQTAKIQATAGKLRILYSFDDPALEGLNPSTPWRQSVYGKNMPDIPTEVFLVVPRNTPNEILNMINETVIRMTKDPEFVSEFKKNNLPLAFVDSDTLRKQMPEMIAGYKKALDDLGLVKK